MFVRLPAKLCKTGCSSTVEAVRESCLQNLFRAIPDDLQNRRRRFKLVSHPPAIIHKGGAPPPYLLFLARRLFHSSTYASFCRERLQGLSSYLCTAVHPGAPPRTPCSSVLLRMCRRASLGASYLLSWAWITLNRFGYDDSLDSAPPRQTSVTSTTTTPAAEPRAGWCKGFSKKHKPKLAAQSGYDGYCKACYVKAFPRKAAAKVAARKDKQHACSVCDTLRELTDGVCKPCRRSFGCREKGCNHINRDTDAAQCRACAESRKAYGAADGKLAMWCPQHTTAEERMTGLCRECFQALCKCYHCGETCDIPRHSRSCVDSDCRERFPLCSKCTEALAAPGNGVQCKGCWQKDGKLCIFCKSRAGQNALNLYRSCRTCHSRYFCKNCNVVSPSYSSTANCTLCARPAVWCSQCYTPDDLSTGLCVTHLENHKEDCQLCHFDSFPAAESRMVEDLACSTNNCARRLRVCSRCLKYMNRDSAQCYPCSLEAGSKCVRCLETPWQNSIKYHHCCKA